MLKPGEISIDYDFDVVMSIVDVEAQSEHFLLKLVGEFLGETGGEMGYKNLYISDYKQSRAVSTKSPSMGPPFRSPLICLERGITNGNLPQMSSQRLYKGLFQNAQGKAYHHHGAAEGDGQVQAGERRELEVQHRQVSSGQAVR